MDYTFALTGTMPLLMHADDVLQADELIAWRKDPKNKSISVPGDDRSPPWTWQTYLHHDGTHLAIPQECIMCALRYAGAKISLPKGKGTFKSLTQSGLLIDSDFCRFTSDGRQVAMEDIIRLRDLPFSQQMEGVRKLGLDLMVKRAKIGEAKHVRVRLMFRVWEIEGTIAVHEPAITTEILDSLFEIAGRTAGLLDWRPNSKKSPGPYGMFTSEIRPLKAARKVG
jgi:hypothetical protein